MATTESAEDLKQNDNDAQTQKEAGAPETKADEATIEDQTMKQSTIVIEDDDEDQREKSKEEDDKDQDGKIQKFISGEKLGAFLQYSLFATWLLHFHVLIIVLPILCCPMMCCMCCVDEDNLIIFVGLTMSFLLWACMVATPYVVTLYLVNVIGGAYSEVQSWQISYCTWSTSCGIIVIILAVGELRDDNFAQKFQSLLLWPFGCSVGPDDHVLEWLIPLVSFAIAIVGGFFANYALDERYLLQCDPTYTDGMCFEELCCQPVGSHEITESNRFLGDLASNILAGWGVVKALTYFILQNDQNVSLKESTKSLFNKDKGKETKTQMEQEIDASERSNEVPTENDKDEDRADDEEQAPEQAAEHIEKSEV